MRRRLGSLAAAAALAGCVHAPVEPVPPIEGATPLDRIAPVVEPPPPEFPAVVLRVRETEQGFVAEVLDVRGAEPDPRPIEGEARRDALRRLESLLGGRAHLVDPPRDAGAATEPLREAPVSGQP